MSCAENGNEASHPQKHSGSSYVFRASGEGLVRREIQGLVQEDVQRGLFSPETHAHQHQPGRGLTVLGAERWAYSSMNNAMSSGRGWGGGQVGGSGKQQADTPKRQLTQTTLCDTIRQPPQTQPLAGSSRRRHSRLSHLGLAYGSISQTDRAGESVLKRSWAWQVFHPNRPLCEALWACCFSGTGEDLKGEASSPALG